MAKNKKKRYKKRKKPYPPLSRLDKAIYYVSAILLTILSLGAIYGIIDIQGTLFFKRSDVLAFASYGSIWNIVPYGLMIAVTFLIVLEKLQKKRPVFGNKEVNYYDSTRYRFILPVFDKRYTDKTLTKEKIIKVSIKTSVIAILFVCSALLSLHGICQRYEFTDTEIRKCNARGETIETISYDSIKEYEVATYSHRSGTRSHTVLYHLGFKIVLPNSETISPDLYIGLKDIDSLYKIDKALKGKPKAVRLDAQEYIDRHSLTDEEERMLREICNEK